MPHSYPFLYKNLDWSTSDWAPLTPKAHSEIAPSNMLAQSIPMLYAPSNPESIPF